MPLPRKLLFVLADGGRARLVERSNATGHFVTVETIDGAHDLEQLRRELRASPSARTHESASPRRSTVGPADYIRSAKEAFMGEVAGRALAVVRARQFDGVVLAAPRQLVGPLRAQFATHTTVAGAIRKDLTKTPDHELGAWLNSPNQSSQPPL
jgi:protein required for attachment to host cells